MELEKYREANEIHEKMQKLENIKLRIRDKKEIKWQASKCIFHGDDDPVYVEFPDSIGMKIKILIISEIDKELASLKLQFLQI